MKEVEILVQVFDEKDVALGKLKKFNFQGIKRTFDIYFCDPVRKKFLPKEDGSFKEVFRIRSKNNKKFITHKINHFDTTGKWIYSDEEEVEVSDFDSARKIVEHLGFKPLVEIENKKHVFLSENYEIVFEDVKDLGLFLEVERLSVSNNENIVEVKKEIREFINSLGLNVKEKHLGKPELMLRKMRK